MIRVLVCDDDPTIGQLIGYWLAEAPDLTLSGHACTRDAALAYLNHTTVDAIVLTSSQNPRALPPGTLQSLTRQLHGPPAEILADPSRAVARARELAGPDGVVIVTGSIYLIADMLAGGRRENASIM